MRWTGRIAPSYKTLKSAVIGSTILVVICYAWLTAHLLEPQLVVPESIVSHSFVRTPDSKLALLADQIRLWPREASRLSAEVAELDPLLNWLGPLKHSVEIVLDEKSPDRILITDTRIEIGANVLFARGQLTKAILKSWILQNASVAVTSSHLRTEVASDVLLGMLKGDFYLEVPGQEDSLSFDRGDKPWWTYADSYQGVCGSS